MLRIRSIMLQIRSIILRIRTKLLPVINSLLEIYSFAGSRWDCILLVFNILFQQSLHINMTDHCLSVFLTLSLSQHNFFLTFALSLYIVRLTWQRELLTFCQRKFNTDAHYANNFPTRLCIE